VEQQVRPNRAALPKLLTDTLKIKRCRINPFSNFNIPQQKGNVSDRTLKGWLKRRMACCKSPTSCL
jgi:hypothetical protein